MKLGEMLVRDGRLTEPQLVAALAAQARDGGRLGTVLVELGLIDLEALTVYLGLELGIPIATGAMLERAKRAAVRLLSPGQSYRFKCVPLVVQDRQLIAAIEDPHDFATLEAIAQQTGYRVLPRVCPELRIYYYIERYYGVPRPARFLKFGDAPRGDEDAVASGLPAPPLPGLPPVPASPVAAPGPRPRLRSVKMAAVKLHEITALGDRFDDSEALELEAEDLIDSLDADTEAPAEAAPIAASPPAAATVVTQPELPALPAQVPVISVDDALAGLATAPDRNRIVDLMLGFAANLFSASVVFTVRDNLAFGWRAAGALPGAAHVEHLLVPLESPSVLQAAVAAENGVVSGPPSPSTVTSHLYKVLGCGEPTHVAAGAIRIGKRLVNIFYGQGPEPLTPLQLEEFTEICKVAAEAYARLIAVKKRR
jgi:hypothetical protein